MVLFLLILSILPSVLILLYIYRKDKYEQEPLALLLKAFVSGALSVVIWLAIYYLLLESIIPTEPDTGSHFANAFIEAFFAAAIPEELVKFAMLYWLIWKNPNFNERFDGIIYAVFVSLGFATLENIMYVLQLGVGVAVLRALTAVPAHALFGVAMGFYFSYAKFLPERQNKYFALCIGIPILLHGVYDFILMWQSNLLEHHPEISVLLMLIFLGFVVFMWIQGFNKIKKLSSDFYFRGVPLSEALEYINNNRPQYVSQPSVQTVSYLRNWHETTPMLFEREKNTITEKYPNAVIEVCDSIVLVSLNTTTNFQWTIQLTYARNYRKLKEQLRIYILQPDLNELAAIANEIPYIKVDLSGDYYLDIASQEHPSGISAIDNALVWINLFEKWVNEEIELNEFVIN